MSNNNALVDKNGGLCSPECAKNESGLVAVRSPEQSTIN